MAGSTGLEPATSCVTGRRSNQLNYDPTKGKTHDYTGSEGPGQRDLGQLADGEEDGHGPRVPPPYSGHLGLPGREGYPKRAARIRRLPGVSHHAHAGRDP